MEFICFCSSCWLSCFGPERLLNVLVFAVDASTAAKSNAGLFCGLLALLAPLVPDGFDVLLARAPARCC